MTVRWVIAVLAIGLLILTGAPAEEIGRAHV